MLTSLRGKLVVIFIAITVGAVAVSSGYAGYMQKQFAVKRAKEQATEDLRLISNEIQTVLQWVIRDIFVLRDLPQLRRFLESENDREDLESLTSVKKAFMVLANHHKIYHQVRFIDEGGMEVVRVNYDGVKTRLVPTSELQNKAHRYYFKEAIHLQTGQIFISPMDLNIEHNVIERPFVPTIRYATPVGDGNGKIQGIIVLNVLGAALLHVLERQQMDVMDQGKRYYLLNTNGYFLFHPDEEKTFGFMLGTEEKLHRYEPNLMPWIEAREWGNSVQKSMATGRRTLFAYQQIPLWTGPLDNYFFSGGRGGFHSTGGKQIASIKAHWYLLSAVEETELLVGLEEYSKPFLFFTLVLLLGCVLVATIVALAYSRPLVSLAGAARRIQQGDLSARAQVYSKDEIGQFGNLFNSMASKLEESVDRLKASETKYRRLFEDSRECFFVSDASGHVIEMNSACANLLGLPQGEVIPSGFTMPWYHGTNDTSKEPSEKRYPLAKLQEMIYKAGYVKDFEVHLIRNDGYHLVCLMTATALRDGNEKIIGWEGLIRDITERRKRIQAKLTFQKQLREEIIMAEERERRALGQVLHEELAQSLALVHLKAQEAEANVLRWEETDGDRGYAGEVKGSLRESRDLLGGMIQKIRTMIFDLYPVMLEEQGLIPTMHWYVQSFSERTGIPVTIYELEKNAELSKPQKVYLYRAFKELLHNSWKHAAAKEAVVTVVGKEESLRLTVDDDGRGFDPEEALRPTGEIKGIGLFSIRDWVTAMGGTFSVESQNGKGTRVLIEIPLQENTGGAK